MNKQHFRTHDLQGKQVVIRAKRKPLKWVGEFLQYFDSNDAVALKNAVVYERGEGEWNQIDELDRVIIDGHSWLTIEHPKVKTG